MVRKHILLGLVCVGILAAGACNQAEPVVHATPPPESSAASGTASAPAAAPPQAPSAPPPAPIPAPPVSAPRPHKTLAAVGKGEVPAEQDETIQDDRGRKMGRIFYEQTMEERLKWTDQVLEKAGMSDVHASQ